MKLTYIFINCLVSLICIFSIAREGSLKGRLPFGLQLHLCNSQVHWPPDLLTQPQREKPDRGELESQTHPSKTLAGRKQEVRREEARD